MARVTVEDSLEKAKKQVCPDTSHYSESKAATQRIETPQQEEKQSGNRYRFERNSGGGGAILPS